MVPAIIYHCNAVPVVTYMKEITCFVFSNNVLNILVDFQNNIK